MAKEDDAWRRLREREDEADREISNEIEASLGKGGKGADSTRTSLSGDKLDELIQRADVAIQQLNNLYNMFVVGVERFPPIERRGQLEQLVAALQSINKATPAALYKYNAIQSRFILHRDKWDKMIKDLESGKIKRTAGPMRRKAS
jgi:hypothetical protein